MKRILIKVFDESYENSYEVESNRLESAVECFLESNLYSIKDIAKDFDVRESDLRNEIIKRKAIH